MIEDFVQDIKKSWNSLKHRSAKYRVKRVGDEGIYDALATVVAHPKYSPTREVLESSVTVGEFNDADELIQYLVENNFLVEHQGENHTFYTINHSLLTELNNQNILLRHAKSLSDKFKETILPLHFDLIEIERPSDVETQTRLLEDFIESTEQEAIYSDAED